MQEERDEDENLQPCGFQVQCRVLFSVYLCVSVPLWFLRRLLHHRGTETQRYTEKKHPYDFCHSRFSSP